MNDDVIDLIRHFGVVKVIANGIALAFLMGVGYVGTVVVFGAMQ